MDFLGEKYFWEANSKTRLLDDLCNLVVSVCAKLEGYAAKTLGGSRIFKDNGFFKKALLPNFVSRLPV